MVVKMMKWRPWPPLLSKKFEVRLVVKRLEGGGMTTTTTKTGNDPVHAGAEKDHRFAVEIRWKGPRIALTSFRRTVKRNFTKEETVEPNGVVNWEEEFQTLCTLSGYRDNVFHPWEIGFLVFHGSNPGPKNKASIVGTASLNLAEFASTAEGKEFELNIPLATSCSPTESRPCLCVSLSILELRASQEAADSVQGSGVPLSSLPQMDVVTPGERDELSALKAGLRKVKIFTEFVSIRKSRKTYREEETSEGRSDECDYLYPFDSESTDEFEGEMDDASKEDSSIRKSFCYGSLAYANCAGGSVYSNAVNNCEDEDWVYYSNRKSDVGCSQNDDLNSSLLSESYYLQNSKHSLLPWKKRKLNFKSPKAKGEPLLKKDYGEEGGDDIDFDRRQLSSDDSVSFGLHKTDESMSAIQPFGDDNFAIGNWEMKEITSRDGLMKVQTEVFFASIDQRSEQAAGESACTALVAVIADWLQQNHNLMPIKSQFDSLIRDGSLEWRNLCENKAYKDRFPDKHFDLETVLQAEIRTLSVVPESSFIGFFLPEETEEGKFDFLEGAMSFDSIWDEIRSLSENNLCSDKSQIYIVSWNDHIFVLKVDSEAYYLIDTLGERLFEGCNQAFILKFDKNTVIHKTTQALERKSATENSTEVSAKKEGSEGLENSLVKEELVCAGKESCMEYIKGFLAAIPIRELQTDMKKGLMTSTPLHHRLQIEFHFTESWPQVPESSSPTMDVTAAAQLQQVEMALTDISA